MINRVHSSIVAFAALISMPCMAAPIPGLFNTGVDGSGVALVGTNVADPHYTVFGGPIGLGPTTAVTFNCCYFADTSSSRWISVNANGGYTPVGIYTYETTFDLTGFDPSTATISGQFAADDAVTATFFNNSNIGVTASGFGSFT